MFKFDAQEIIILHEICVLILLVGCVAKGRGCKLRSQVDYKTDKVYTIIVLRAIRLLSRFSLDLSPFVELIKKLVIKVGDSDAESFRVGEKREKEKE